MKLFDIISKNINKYKFNSYIKFEFNINNVIYNDSNKLNIFSLDDDDTKYNKLIEKLDKINTWYDITETSYNEYIKNNLTLYCYNNGSQICYYKNIIDVLSFDNTNIIIFTNDIAPLEQFENSFNYDYIYNIKQRSYLTNNISINLKTIEYDNNKNYLYNITYTPKPGKNKNPTNIINSICEYINLMNE